MVADDELRFDAEVGVEDGGLLNEPDEEGVEVGDGAELGAGGGTGDGVTIGELEVKVTDFQYA